MRVAGYAGHMVQDAGCKTTEVNIGSAIEGIDMLEMRHRIVHKDMQFVGSPEGLHYKK